MYPAYPGRRATDRRSIRGTLTATKSTSIASGPQTLHHQRGSAATQNSHRPHQKPISPR